LIPGGGPKRKVGPQNVKGSMVEWGKSKEGPFGTQ